MNKILLFLTFSIVVFPHFGIAEDRLNSDTTHTISCLSYEMRYIQPGTFVMGTPSDEPYHRNDEKQHSVTLKKGFFIGVNEVTEVQWKSIMPLEECPNNYPLGCKDPEDSMDCPVNCISWDMAQEFILKLNEIEGTDKYRLPTEAEWEYACRAGSNSATYNGPIKKKSRSYFEINMHSFRIRYLKVGFPYPTILKKYIPDPTLDRIAWHSENACLTKSNPLNSECYVHPVGHKMPNAWGLHDMIGNVSEWCQDSCEWQWEVPNEIGRLTSDTYVDGIIDPLCTKGPQRILRGGAVGMGPGALRSGARSFARPGSAAAGRGLRLVMDR